MSLKMFSDMTEMVTEMLLMMNWYIIYLIQDELLCLTTFWVNGYPEAS